MSKKYTIRNASRDELNVGIQWAADEGWNPGLYDRDCFYDTDPEGYFIGYLDKEPISFISAVAYDDSFGFLGFYIVKPEYRKRGYGIKIWNKAVEYLKTQNIGLDGVVEQQGNYKKSGFKLAYNNARHEYISEKLGVDNKRIVLAESVDFNKLNRYDKRFFPTDRSGFVKCWIKQPESFCLVYLEDRKIAGYGMIRKCRKGFKIGPLFTDSFDVTDQLFKVLAGKVKEGSQIYLDIPEINKEAVRLVNKYKMKKVFASARMYTKEFPKLPIEKIFGVTTFELG